MLVLSRKIKECFMIDDEIRVTILSTRGKHVRVGIEAPSRVRVVREELMGRSPAQGNETDAARATRLRASS